jgi:hypothetical protein
MHGEHDRAVRAADGDRDVSGLRVLADVAQRLLGAAMLLGTTRNSQLTYAGHPLYRYAGDEAAGDTNGEGLTQFGGGWDVLAPSGHKIEGGETTAPSNGGGNGW